MEEHDFPTASKSISWNADRIVSLSAIFISLMTLLTFIYQNRLLQKQAAHSVLPYLAINSSYDDGDDPSFRLRLANRGVGPAIIESRKITYGDKTHTGEFYEFLNDHIEGLDSMENIARTSFEFGTVLPSTEELIIIGVYEDADQVDLIAGTLEALTQSGLKFEIIYRSIYGDRWKITESSNLPIPLPKAAE